MPGAWDQFMNMLGNQDTMGQLTLALGQDFAHGTGGANIANLMMAKGAAGQAQNIMAQMFGNPQAMMQAAPPGSKATYGSDGSINYKFASPVDGGGTQPGNAQFANQQPNQVVPSAAPNPNAATVQGGQNFPLPTARDIFASQFGGYSLGNPR